NRFRAANPPAQEPATSRSCCRGIGSQHPPRRLFAGTEAELHPRRGAEGAGSRFCGSMLAGKSGPVPEDWLRGIDVQRRDFEEFGRTRPSYLAGQWRERGWWYYYLYALAVKLPLGTIALILGGLALAVFRCKQSAAWREELAIYLP